MALDADKLAQEIEDAMAGKKVITNEDGTQEEITTGYPENAGEANKRFGDAVVKHIIENMEITYGWAASNVDGTPDPAASFPAVLSDTESGTLSPSVSFADMIIALPVLIHSRVQISPPALYFLALTFNPAALITAVMAGESTPQTALLNFCTQLVSSLKSSFPNPSPSSGSHASYTGSTVSMAIT